MIGTLFWLLTLAGCAYASAVGGRDGRWATALILTASGLTIPATRMGSDWASTETLVLMVDVALLVGLLILAINSRRYFPVWMSGFHLVAVTTHLGTIVAMNFTPHIYRALESIWAIPMTMVMIWGIHRDRTLSFG